MTDIINQLKALTLFAAKALVAAAVPIVTMFVTDALEILSAGTETLLAAAAAAVVVYFVPNRSLNP